MANRSRSRRFVTGSVPDLSRMAHVQSPEDERPFWDTLSDPRGSRKKFDSSPEGANRRSVFHVFGDFKPTKDS